MDTTIKVVKSIKRGIFICYKRVES